MRNTYNRMETIMHIITRLDRGGSAQNTLLTCIELSNKYHMILINGPSLESNMTTEEKTFINNQLKEFRRRDGVHYINPYLVRDLKPLSDLHALLWLIKAIRYHNPSIVHTHTSKAGALGRISAFMWGIRKIVHTPHGHVFYGHFPPLKSRIFLWIERFLGIITSRIIALTNGEKSDYIKKGVYPGNKITTIHSGVDVKLFRKPSVPPEIKRRELGLNPDAPVVGTAGWLSPVKGSIALLLAMEQVWKKHPECQLIFVGRGELEAKIREIAIQMKHEDKVFLLGWRNDMPDIMHMMDIFVLPSLNEGMGRVIVEAMSSGKPVIASRTGGIVDLVEDGKNGFLITPGDIKGLSSAIIRLLSNYELTKKMGEKGRETSSKFSIEAMIEKIDMLYQELLRM